MKSTINGFTKFIIERHSIYTRRLQGLPKPWTKDPILQSYRFCNVYRELDKETSWIRTHWRELYKNEPDLWFAMVVARLINWSPTLEAIGFPVPWNVGKFLTRLEQRKPHKVWGGAYIVSTNGEPVAKDDYIAFKVLSPLWNERKRMRPQPGVTLAEYHARLLPFNGMGTFIAAQVVADLKYTDPLSYAEDWWTWAASGPGSRRGLARLLWGGIERRHELRNEELFRHELLKLNVKVEPVLQSAGLPRLHAQDLQNCLCEFDKYERTRLGEGRPRTKFPGKE